MTSRFTPLTDDALRVADIRARKMMERHVARLKQRDPGFRLACDDAVAIDAELERRGLTSDW